MTLVLNIPEHANLEQRELTRFLAAKLYEAGKLSLGQAAEMAGYSRLAFAEILGDYGVSLFNYPAEEIITDAAKI